MKNEFYVYIYLDPRSKGIFSYGKYTFDYEPFYIGKGKDDRYKRHIRKSEYTKNNNYKNNKIKSIINSGFTPIITKFKVNLNEDEAHKLEEDMITQIGRHDLGFGPLGNFTNGGEGSSGKIMSKTTKKKLRNINLGKTSKLKGKTYEEIYGKQMAKEMKEKMKLARLGKTYKEIYGGEDIVNEIKEKISKGNLGKVYSKETREKISKINLGRKASEETRKKISTSLIGNNRHKGHKHSEKTKKQISKAKMGTPSWNAQPVLQLDKNSKLVKQWRSAHKAAKELGLSQGNIWSVINGNRKTCGGFKWKISK